MLYMLPSKEIPMRAGIYARVSTSDQSTAMHLVALREYVERQGWQLVAEHVDGESRAPRIARLRSTGSWPMRNAEPSMRSWSFALTALPAPSRIWHERSTS